MAATSFYGGEFFGGEFFNAPDAPQEEEATRPRPDDRGRRKKLTPKGRIYKPTGLVDRKREIPEGRKTVDERVADSIEIQAEAAQAIAQQLREQREAPVAVPIEQMSLAEIEREVGLLMRKKLRTEEDEVIMLLLIAVAAAMGH